MKKLMVAGCSFSATTKSKDGTSWSEVLAERLGWELVNLARQGCSNGGIRIQMDEIRRQRPDFAIIGPTFWDRMEIPADSAPYDWNQPPSRGEAPPLEHHLRNSKLGNGYDRADGILNINYGRGPSRMICETIFTLAENFEHPYRTAKITKQAQTGIRHWIDSVYDSAWKKQCDEWIIREGVLMMYLEGINFLVIPGLLWPYDPGISNQWRRTFPEMIPYHYVVMEENESPLSICNRNPFNGEDPGYHGNALSQILIADNWYRRMIRDHGIS